MNIAKARRKDLLVTSGVLAIYTKSQSPKYFFDSKTTCFESSLRFSSTTTKNEREVGGEAKEIFIRRRR